MPTTKIHPANAIDNKKTTVSTSDREPVGAM
jgi:hypothetical protein